MHTSWGSKVLTGDQSWKLLNCLYIRAVYDEASSVSPASKFRKGQDARNVGSICEIDRYRRLGEPFFLYMTIPLRCVELVHTADGHLAAFLWSGENQLTVATHFSFTVINNKDPTKTIHQGNTHALSSVMPLVFCRWSSYFWIWTTMGIPENGTLVKSDQQSWRIPHWRSVHCTTGYENQASSKWMALDQHQRSIGYLHSNPLFSRVPVGHMGHVSGRLKTFGGWVHGDCFQITSSLGIRNGTWPLLPPEIFNGSEMKVAGN